MKSFSKWTIIDVEKEFQVNLQDDNPLLQSWLDTNGALSQEEAIELTRLQGRLNKHVYDWNEHELKVKFITRVLELVDFDQNKYQSFLERVISAPYNNDSISGDIDFVVANGRRAPEQPYFFLHEYKKDIDSSGDPLGQLLVAMIAAQILNEDAYPIYGAYVVGRFWYFVVIDGKDYAVSLAYDATKDEINDIFKILQKAKAIIDERIQNQQA